MRKTFLAVLLATVALFISCDKNDDSTNEYGNSGSIDASLVGMWFWPDAMHTNAVTLNQNGTYDWETAVAYSGRIKDTGTWSVKGNVITMQVKEHWTTEDLMLMEDSINTYTKSDKWVIDTERDHQNDPKTRTCTIYFRGDGYLIMTVEGNSFFYSEATEAQLFTREWKGFDNYKPVDPNAVKGNWEIKDSKGKICGLLSMDGSKYTQYRKITTENWEDGAVTYHDYTTKETGTYSFDSKGFLVMQPDKYQQGYNSYYSQEENRWVYEYSRFNENTLEADNWYEQEGWQGWPQELMVFAEGNKLALISTWGQRPSGPVYTKK